MKFSSLSRVRALWSKRCHLFWTKNFKHSEIQKQLGERSIIFFLKKNTYLGISNGLDYFLISIISENKYFASKLDIEKCCSWQNLWKLLESKTFKHSKYKNCSTSTDWIFLKKNMDLGISHHVEYVLTGWDSENEYFVMIMVL